MKTQAAKPKKSPGAKKPPKKFVDDGKGLILYGPDGKVLKPGKAK